MIFVRMGNCRRLNLVLTLVGLVFLQFHQVKARWSRGRGSSRRTYTSYKVSQEVLSKTETNLFMQRAYEKLGSIKCITFIWDNHLALIVESMSQCSYDVPACTAYKYMTHYEGGNMSSMMLNTLRAGHRRQCGAYVILLQQPSLIIKLLRVGDDNRLINTRARFLIWYEQTDRQFEGDEIWGKIPNVILFHSKAKKRQTGVLFTIRGLRWPVVPNTTDSHTRVIEFWGQDHTAEEERRDIPWWYDKTTDLRNSTLRILVVEHPPGVVKLTDARGRVSYAGTEIEIVKVLSTIMNFAYELDDADAVTKWGGVGNSSGRAYFGAVSRLIYGERDMAIGSFFILKHYLTQLDMSIPLEVVCTSFLTPTPLPRSRYLALILPFSTELWILVLTICLILSPLGLYALARLRQHRTEYAVFRKPEHLVLTSFRLMSQVALHIWPRFWPIRLYIGWYWLFWLCITLAYRAAMVAFLTIPLLENPIDNLADLAGSRLRLGGWGTELHRLFTQHQALNEGTIRGSLNSRYEVIDDLDAAVSMVADGSFALYENVRYLRFIRMTRNLSKNGVPSMRLMKQCIVPVHIGFAYQKNSPITLTVNRYIRIFQESGLVKRWGQRLVTLTREHNKEVSENDGSETKEESPDDSAPDSGKSRKQRVLTLQDLQGAVYLLLLGGSLSLLAFIGELSYRNSKKAAQLPNKALLGKLVQKTKYMVEVQATFGADGSRRKGKKRRKSKKAPPFPYIE